MRGCDVGRFVGPNGPGPERDLASDQCDPKDRQSFEHNQVWHVPPDAKTKRNHPHGNNERKKAVRHLQPDLECSHIREGAGIAPRVDPCKRNRTGIGNPRAVCRGKIENRQVAVLMAHCCPERELHVNRNRDCKGKRLDRRGFL